jgi:hypothetical protein
MALNDDFSNINIKAALNKQNELKEDPTQFSYSGGVGESADGPGKRLDARGPRRFAMSSGTFARLVQEDPQPFLEWGNAFKRGNEEIAARFPNMGTAQG